MNARRCDAYRTPSPDDYRPPVRQAVDKSPRQDRHRRRPGRVGDASTAHQQEQRARRRARENFHPKADHTAPNLEKTVSQSQGPAAGEEKFWQPRRNGEQPERAQDSCTKPAKSASPTKETRSWESATSDGETETLRSATPSVSKQASLQSLPKRSSRSEPVNPSLSIMVFPTVTQEEPVATRWTNAIKGARQKFEKWRDAFIAAESDSDLERCEGNRNRDRDLHSRLIAMDRAERNSSNASAPVVRPERRTSSSNSPSERRSGSDVNGEASEDSGGEETDRSTCPPREEDSHPRSLHHHYCQVQKRRKSRRAKPE
ncbi:MAG: hypothetical protein Q9176_007954 [Flavoplaca citrina]